MGKAPAHECCCSDDEAKQGMQEAVGALGLGPPEASSAQHFSGCLPEQGLVTQR